MTSSFIKALRQTLGVEGDFSDHPADPGGATRFGITERTARRHGYTGDMRALPVEVAERIYRDSYWSHRRLPCQAIADWYEPAALEVFDTAVNVGVRRTATWVQRALNDLSRYAGLALIEEDGWVGTGTLERMHAFTRPIEQRVFVQLLDNEQGSHYRRLVRRRPDMAAFLLGWFDKRVGATPPDAENGSPTV